MNRLATAILIAFMVIGTASAQSQSVPDSTGTQSPSRWALQFAVDDEQISGFLGSAISLKRDVTARSAWRVGVSVSIDPGSKSEETEVRVFNSPSDTLTASASSNSSSSYSLAARWQWLRLFGLAGKSKAFWGIGPVGSYYHYEYAATSLGNSALGYTDERNDFSLGLVLSLGVEWQPTANIGFSGEYGIQPVYQWSEDKYVRTEIAAYQRRTTRLTKSSGIKIDATSVRLGLSVYF